MTLGAINALMATNLPVSEITASAAKLVVMPKTALKASA